MGIGHIAVAFASKRFAPQVSLGLLIFATMLVDELFAVMVLLGLERVRIEPGATAAYPFVLEHYPITHSLVGGIGWALLAGLAYFAWRRDRSGALFLGGAVLSHWLLDLVAHTPDLPVLPSGPYLGLGLWNSLAGTLIVEAVLVAVSVAVYLASTRARDRIGSWGLGALMVVVALVHAGVYLGPPPPSVPAAMIGLLVLILPVLAAHWIDRHRAPVQLHPVEAPAS